MALPEKAIAGGRAVPFMNSTTGCWVTVSRTDANVAHGGLLDGHNEYANIGTAEKTTVNTRKAGRYLPAPRLLEASFSRVCRSGKAVTVRSTAGIAPR